MRAKPYRAALLTRLEDDEYAVGYLSRVLSEESPEAFLISLRDVIDARSENISSLADRAGLTRQAVYQAFSKTGNPRFSTITQVLNVLGLQLLVASKDAA